MQVHWNVTGMNFMPLHQFFDELAAAFIRCADMIAERATALGGGAEGTVRMATANSRIEELLIGLTDEQCFLRAMAERFAQCAAPLLSAIDESAHWNDATLSDLFTETSREVDKSLWFIEPHLQAWRRNGASPLTGEEMVAPVPSPACASRFPVLIQAFSEPEVDATSDSCFDVQVRASDSTTGWHLLAGDGCDKCRL